MVITAKLASDRIKQQTDCTARPASDKNILIPFRKDTDGIPLSDGSKTIDGKTIAQQVRSEVTERKVRVAAGKRALAGVCWSAATRPLQIYVGNKRSACESGFVSRS